MEKISEEQIKKALETNPIWSCYLNKNQEHAIEEKDQDPHDHPQSPGCHKSL